MEAKPIVADGVISQELFPRFSIDNSLHNLANAVSKTDEPVIIWDRARVLCTGYLPGGSEVAMTKAETEQFGKMCGKD